ncbi:MAG: ABC transporter substrate-binding protein [Firmicutes bacterium]|nr:ABC transporter substrate-binding protein [Bacillota bacterium]
MSRLNKILKIAFLVLSVLCLTLLIAACGPATELDPDKKIVVDLIGNEVAVPKEPQRIAAMTGPSYEMVFMLGAADKVAMVKSGHTTNYPLALLTYPELANINTVAANPSSSVNIEDYLKHNVDLVIYYENDTELKKFRDTGVPAVVLTLNTGFFDSKEDAMNQGFDTYKTNATAAVKTLSEILGTEEAKNEFDTWYKYTTEKLELVYNRTKDIKEEDRPIVYWGNTWGENILASYGIQNRCYEVWLAGGNLVGPVGGGNFPEVTAEQLYDWDPDIILVDNHGNYPDLVIKHMMKEGGQWQTLRAVKNNQLHRIPAGVFFLDKGTTNGLIILWLATVIQPELFTDVNMAEEIKYYYNEFYEYEMTLDEAQKVLDGWHDILGDF